MIARGDPTVHIQQIIVGCDFGNDLAMLDGLEGDETILTNPSDALHEGSRVQVAKGKETHSVENLNTVVAR